MRINATLLALTAAFLALTAWVELAGAQDAEDTAVQQAGSVTDDDGSDGTTADDAAVDGAEVDADEDNQALDDLDNPDFADLDEQSYEEDDDDFVPTEEVPADQAIPFPSDI